MFSGTTRSHKTPIREIFGAASLSISSRFPLTSGEFMDKPVTFPPGRARLAATQAATGSPLIASTMGVTTVSSGRSRTRSKDQLDFFVDQVSSERRNSIWVSFCESVLNENILIFNIAQIAQALAKRLEERTLTVE